MCEKNIQRHITEINHTYAFLNINRTNRKFLMRGRSLFWTLTLPVFAPFHFVLVPVKDLEKPNRLLAQHFSLGAFIALHLQSLKHTGSNCAQNELNTARKCLLL